MEGMLSKKLVGLQVVYRAGTGEGGNMLSWAKQLVIRLLVVTHGHWIFRNTQVHDETQGTLRTWEKELLQQEIEVEMELGFNGFLAMERLLASVMLEDLEAGNGEQQEYWLLAVRAARKAKVLTDGNAAVACSLIDRKFSGGLLVASFDTPERSMEGENTLRRSLTAALTGSMPLAF
jgi:hypothetical protein